MSVAGIVQGLENRADGVFRDGPFVYGVTHREYPASSLFYQAYAYRYWVSMKQIHSAACYVVGPECLGNDRHVVIPDVDALVTREPRILLSVRTADCLPIVVMHPSGVMGVVHAGRKGTESGIMIETLRCIADAFGVRDELSFWFGPAICGRCYQVDRERDLYVDLASENRAQISAVLDSGMYRIEESGTCTLENPQTCYSYRSQGQAAGRLHTYVIRSS